MCMNACILNRNLLTIDRKQPISREKYVFVIVKNIIYVKMVEAHLSCKLSHLNCPFSQ
jgi:hypothetical protein